MPASANTTEADALPKSDGKWLSVNQYRVLYGFSQTTILNAIKRGELRGRRKGRAYEVWDEAEVFDGSNALENVAFIKISEAAEILGITGRAVAYYITGQDGRKPKMKAIRVGGRFYTTISELRRMIAERANYSLHGKRRKRVREAVIELVRHKLLEP